MNPPEQSNIVVRVDTKIVKAVMQGQGERVIFKWDEKDRFYKLLSEEK